MLIKVKFDVPFCQELALDILVAKLHFSKAYDQATFQNNRLSESNFKRITVVYQLQMQLSSKTVPTN